jgi:hypothetical protein
MNCKKQHTIELAKKVVAVEILGTPRAGDFSAGRQQDVAYLI